MKNAILLLLFLKINFLVSMDPNMSLNDAIDSHNCCIKNFNRNEALNLECKCCVFDNQSDSGCLSNVNEFCSRALNELHCSNTNDSCSTDINGMKVELECKKSNEKSTESKDKDHEEHHHRHEDGDDSGTGGDNTSTDDGHSLDSGYSSDSGSSGYDYYSFDM